MKEHVERRPFGRGREIRKQRGQRRLLDVSKVIRQDHLGVVLRHTLESCFGQPLRDNIRNRARTGLVVLLGKRDDDDPVFERAPEQSGGPLYDKGEERDAKQHPEKRHLVGRAGDSCCNDQHDEPDLFGLLDRGPESNDRERAEQA